MRATVTSIICAGWKELGKKKVHCINAWDFKAWNKNVNDDREVCQAIYEVLKDADAVITHNGIRFDWKYLQTRLVYNGFPPLHKIKHIDTCSVAKRNFLSFNNKLGYLGDWLVKDNKLENGGWELWVKVHRRDKKAQKLMERYCKQDVILLEKVFLKLRPFIKNLPNRNHFRPLQKTLDNKNVCPTCGSTDLKKWGFYRTSVMEYQRYRCGHCFSCCHTDANDRKARA